MLIPSPLPLKKSASRLLLWTNTEAICISIYVAVSLPPSFWQTSLSSESTSESLQRKNCSHRVRHGIQQSTRRRTSVPLFLPFCGKLNASGRHDFAWKMCIEIIILILRGKLTLIPPVKRLNRNESRKGTPRKGKAQTPSAKKRWILELQHSFIAYPVCLRWAFMTTQGSAS